MRDRRFLEAGIFGRKDTDRPVFTNLRGYNSLDFPEAMVDPELVSVADGMKRMMAELGIESATEVAAVSGHEVKEVSMISEGAQGSTSRSNGSGSPIHINKALRPRVKEFVTYHELGHQILFRFTSGRHSEVQPQQEEVFCDAFACLMIGNKMPPRPERPQRL